MRNAISEYFLQKDNKGIIEESIKGVSDKRIEISVELFSF